MKSKFSKIIKITIILIIAYVTYVAFDICLYSKVNEMTKADAAIILGAGVSGEKPSPVFQERINHGIWLYKNGYVDKLIFTGGKGKNEKFSEASVAKRYAIGHSIPSQDILIEEQSTITQENIENASRIAQETSISTVIIVSDPLHMKRAMLMAKDYGLTAYSSPTPTTRYKKLVSKTLFLSREIFFYIGYELYRLF
ncbi:MAG: YdcF family protein [Chitinophagales bacterium]